MLNSNDKCSERVKIVPFVSPKSFARNEKHYDIKYSKRRAAQIVIDALRIDAWLIIIYIVERSRVNYGIVRPVIHGLVFKIASSSLLDAVRIISLATEYLKMNSKPS